MNTCIKACRRWLDLHPRAKQWAWFAALWCGGLFTAAALAYPFKWLVRAM